MKKLKLTLSIMTLMFAVTTSAWADGVMISDESKDGVLVSNVSSENGIISSHTTDGEMGFPKSQSTYASSILDAILGLF